MRFRWFEWALFSSFFARYGAQPQCSTKLIEAAERSPGTFTDGSMFGDAYGRNLDCTWRIRSTADNPLPVQIKFTRLAITQDIDTIQIFDGMSDSDELLATVSGRITEPEASTCSVFTSLNGALFVRFTTADSPVPRTSTGWEMQYIINADTKDLTSSKDVWSGTWDTDMTCVQQDCCCPVGAVSIKALFPGDEDSDGLSAVGQLLISTKIQGVACPDGEQIVETVVDAQPSCTIVQAGPFINSTMLTSARNLGEVVYLTDTSKLQCGLNLYKQQISSGYITITLILIFFTLFSGVFFIWKTGCPSKKNYSRVPNSEDILAR